MKAQKVRNLLFVAVFAVMLVVSNVAPAAAHTHSPRCPLVVRSRETIIHSEQSYASGCPEPTTL